MSQPHDRGLGRARRGDSTRNGSSTSSKSSSSAKSMGRATSTKQSIPPSEIGEAKTGFMPSSVDIESRALDVESGARGEPSYPSPGTVVRGSFRGRRKIDVVEIVKTRPATCCSKKGDYGTKVNLLSNYFKLETMTDWTLYQYRVNFNVQEERISVLRAWLKVHKDRLKSAYLFDGTMLFTSQRLTPGNEVLTLTSIRESDHQAVEIDIKLVQQLNYGNAVYLQIFNILVRRCLANLKLQLVHRNYFDAKSTIHLPQHCLEVWPGYITSIRQHENAVLMCAEISHKVMRTDTALKMLTECFKNTDYKRIYQQAMIGCVVLTDYNNKTYRIDDVDFSLTPLSSFKYKNNETITYVKYYEERYQIRITDLKQPLLISRASAKDIRGGKDQQCLLVPELCRMTGLSSKMLENRSLMKDLAEITRISPGTRIDRLKKFNDRLHNEPLVVEDFKQWGMTLSKDLITVQGREFPPEKLVAGRLEVFDSGTEVDWTKSLRSSPMLHYGKFDSFAVLCPTRFRRETEEFLTCLKKAASGMSFRIPKPFVLETESDSPGQMIDGTEKALARFHPDLIMYVFTNERSDRYSAIKKKCYVDRGILSQVVLYKSLTSRNVMSVATKVAIQLNCKLGGAPWTVTIPAENVMVIGFDVCHDKSQKSQSVGALVASLNKAMSAWYSTVTQHTSGEELSNTLALDVYNAIRKYQQVNDKLPNRIFFYRDGVGEGQINHVYHHEVVAVKKKLTELYGGNTWKLAFIIVTKRIHTRFFYEGRNPRPGTIVDDVVTQPEKYDFYLVSQSVRQGTVTPTGYNVISDNLEWKPNHIQRFTYKMTHLYYNCSTTVRVPAPCQYAHKLAFMVSQNLHGPPHENLQKKLYFL